jgi:NSS family neurotransmitter:Na+ symporter
MSAETQGSGGRGQWGTRVGFILAAAGSAVGLGNIWKFPYITGENGGGLFVLIYLVCIALVGIPIMVAELMIGRAAQKQPVVAFEVLQGDRKTAWSAVGWLGVLAGFVILSYYVVVAGWAMDFTLKSMANFTEPIAAEAEEAGLRYRVSTPLDEMREMLVERRAERESHAAVVTARASAAPSEWEALGRLATARDAAGDEGEAVLLADHPELTELAAPALAAQTEIERLQTEARAEATTHYEGLGERDVREEAEAVTRRAAIHERVSAAFVGVATDGWTSAFWATLFMAVTILVVAQGVGQGIESACRVLMPVLFGLILLMVVYGATTPGFGSALTFVFKPDPTRLQPKGVLEALGHAFFTLSLGMGAMITYGSYLQRRGDIVRQGLWIAALDTVVAILACLMIFPITFTFGEEPTAGPGLVFMSMPLAFAEMGSGGLLLAVLFFGLLVVAALTSAISLLEVVASYFIDQRGWGRKRAAWVMGGLILAFGLPSAFAMDPDFAMSGWEASTGMNFFDTMDYLASNWMLPAGGLLIAVYAGWIMPKRIREAELEGMPALVVTGWLVLIRYVAPLLVLLVLADKIGLIDVEELF